MEIRIKATRSENCGGKRTGAPRYLVVHYTANLGDTAQNNAEYFAREIVKASAHYFVDENEVWQSVPDDTVAWHCGGKTYYHAECRNANSIGVEICMLDKNGGVREDAVERAAQLVRELMERYDIDVSCVLRHYDVTHKSCPAPMVEDEARWAAFKQRLEVKPMANDAPAGWAKTAWEKASVAKVMDGTRPTEPVTRQELAVILDRLGLVK